jgi:hypothetical protein
MKRQLVLISAEILLVTAVGFFANIAAASLNISGAYVWIALILLLLSLISTTWFRSGLHAGLDQTNDDRPRWKLVVPEKITISISLESIKKNFRFLLGLAINGFLFGYFVAYSSLFATSSSRELSHTARSAYQLVAITGMPNAHSFEIVGVLLIAFASATVSRRLSSLITGVLFCIISSLVFSATHLRVALPQPVGLTFLGNLLSALIVMVICLLLYPLWTLLIKQIVEFWRQP